MKGLIYGDGFTIRRRRARRWDLPKSLPNLRPKRLYRCAHCNRGFWRTVAPVVLRRPGATCSRPCALSLPRGGYKNKMAALPDPVRGARWISLSKGKFALVDAEDFDRVRNFSWYVSTNEKGSSYAAYRTHSDENRTIVYLHRVIMGIEDERTVDHRDRNTFDCRKKNLRIATDHKQNRNRGKHVSTVRNISSVFKGVFRPSRSTSRSARPWGAHITVNDQTLHLGAFATQEEAARAYDAEARKRFGRFACLNFPRRGEQSALS